MSTVFQKSAHQYSANISISRIFNLSKKQKLKFYLFKFHNVFDGLLGLDNLKLLRANLDFENGFLLTPHAKIKLQYHRTQTRLNCITVSPRAEQVIGIKTTIKNGETIAPYQKLHNCEIPESLTIARNEKAVKTILNNTDDSITLNFCEPIEAEKFDRVSIENLNFNNFDKETPEICQKTKTSNTEPIDIIINNSVNEHKEKSKLLHSQINENLIKQKEKVIGKINSKDRDNPDLFEVGQEVRVKKHVRQKNARKFARPTKIVSLNTKRKTATTGPRDKVHLSNIKRPLKKNI